MINKDYLMRLLEEFMKVLGKMLFDTNDKDEIKIEINFLSEQYLKYPFSFFESLDKNEAITLIKDDNTADKVQILAELMYQFSKAEENQTRQKVTLEKAKYFYNYVQEHLNVFSLSIENKIIEIGSRLDCLD